MEFNHQTDTITPSSGTLNIPSSLVVSTGLSVSGSNVVTEGSSSTLINKALTNPQINTLNDSIYNIPVLTLTGVGATAVNNLELRNSVTGNNLIIQALGTDSIIDIDIRSKGASGIVKADGIEILTTSKVQTVTNKSISASQINSGTLGITVGIGQGGTGQVTANGALNALLPSQTGNSGKLLQTNGTDASWVTFSGGLSDSGSNGVLIRTALNTTISRTLTGTTNRLVITNGNGVSGNPTFDIGSHVLNWNSALKVSATGNITTNSTTDVLVTGMTLSPSAGNYLLSFNSSVSNSNNGRTMTFSIYINGVQVSGSVLVIGVASGNNDIVATPIVNFPITILGGESVEIRWRTSANTATLRDRYMALIKVG